VYRIFQDLEARLGIQQGSVSPPEHRDFLRPDRQRVRVPARVLPGHGLDPGQLSCVFAGRADLSLRTLHRVLRILQARLIIQAEEQAQEQTSVARAEEALALATQE
jgi:hypothetical protein